MNSFTRRPQVKRGPLDVSQLHRGSMRVLQVLGVVLVIAGVVLLWKRPTFRTRQDVVEIGEFKASVEQQEGLPLWVGAAAAGAGVLLLVASSRRRG